MMLRNDKK